MTTTLTLYVPAGENALGIRPGSAIVGSADGDRLVLDAEGDLYGAHGAGGRRFSACLLHAAGRHEARYPTTARWRLPAGGADLMRAVGTYRTGNDPRLEVTDPPALDAWAGRLGADTASILAAIAAERRERELLALGRDAWRGDPTALARLRAMGAWPLR